MVSFAVDYGRVKLEDIHVHPEGDDRDEQFVTQVGINDERFTPSDRFWKSFFAGFGISQSIFRYYSHS